MLHSEEDFNVLKTLYSDKERNIQIGRINNDKLQIELNRHKHNIKTKNNDTEFRNYIRNFLDYIEKETIMNFFLVEIKQNGEFSLIKRDLSLMINISCNTATKSILPFVSNRIVLSLNNISCMEKGKAYRFMTRYIKYAKKVNLPIILWTEIEKNTKYFERYGFVACGNMGDNQEMLMVLNP
jgi:hypothetical protein